MRDAGSWAVLSGNDASIIILVKKQIPVAGPAPGVFLSFSRRSRSSGGIDERVAHRYEDTEPTRQDHRQPRKNDHGALTAIEPGPAWAGRRVRSGVRGRVGACRRPGRPWRPTTSRAWAPASIPAAYAITGAKIVTAPGKTIDPGTIVVRRGMIEAVGLDQGRDGPLRRRDDRRQGPGRVPRLHRPVHDDRPAGGRRAVGDRQGPAGRPGRGPA